MIGYLDVGRRIVRIALSNYPTCLQLTELSRSVVLGLTTYLFLFALVGVGTSGAQVSFSGPDERFINDTDRIHQGDIIEVDVVGSFEYDWRGKLNPEGFIDGIERLPEPIFARCRSTASLANAIAEQYRKMLRDPVVDVRIIDRNGRAISQIDGAVRTPLRLLIKRDVHLNEVIVLAGGFTDIIGSEIAIFRPEGASCEGAGSSTLPKGPVSNVVKLSAMLSGAKGANPKILSGDLITVVKSLPVYVIGGVGNPQRIASREGITLSRAIDTAGGIAKGGRTDKIYIYRRSEGQTRVIEADLDKIRSGVVEDPQLKANDIVEVPHKRDAKRDIAPVLELHEPESSQMPLRNIE
jgi:protein involved in polysaccharide export with SLBB domain